MSEANRQARSALSVPLLDLKAQYATLKPEIDAAIAEVCASQRFILGPHVEGLERDIAQYTACSRGVGVSSGTDALLLALMALDLKPGEEVITTPYSFFATAGVVARLGARPLFADIDPVTYNISPAAVEDLIERTCETRDGALFNRVTGGRVRVLMPVHLYGQVADMDALLAIARRRGLLVVEDAAQAVGSQDAQGRRAGSLGDIACFSFFPSKNLGGFGDGGMCTTNDDELADRMRILRTHGAEPKYYHAFVGGNFRLDALQAAVLEVKLKYLDQWTAARQENAAYYTAGIQARGLGEQVATPVATPGCRHIYNQYIVSVDRRDELRDHLGACDVGTEIYYPVPLHLQQCFTDLGYRAGDLPHAEQAASSTLALPVYPELSREQLDYTLDCIAEFYN